MEDRRKVRKYVCLGCNDEDTPDERCILFVSNGEDPHTCVFGFKDCKWEQCHYV